MSSLRSTKDLKGIIEKARKVNFSSNVSNVEESTKINEVDSSSDDEKSYDMRFEKKG